MLFCFTKTLAGGCPRTPVARHLHGRGAPEPDHLMAHASRAAAASRSALVSAPPSRFRGSTIRREAVEFLDRKPETGGTPTPPGVEFVRYRPSHGLGFRQTVPKRPRMAVRAVFRVAGHGCHPVGQRPRLRTAPPAFGGSRPSFRLAGPSRIMSAGSSARTGQRSAAAPTTGFGRWSTPPLAAPAAGRQKRGQRGRSPPPASLGDTRSVAPASKLARLRNASGASSEKRLPKGAPNASSRLPLRRKPLGR